MQTNSSRLRPMHCRKIHFCTAKIALKIEGGIDTVGAHHGLDILAAHRLFHGVLLSRCPAAILLSVTLALLTAKVNGRFVQSSAHILPFLCHTHRRQGNTAPRPAARAPKRRDSPLRRLFTNRLHVVRSSNRQKPQDSDKMVEKTVGFCVLRRKIVVFTNRADIFERSGIINLCRKRNTHGCFPFPQRGNDCI